MQVGAVDLPGTWILLRVKIIQVHRVGLGVNPSKKKILCCSDTAGDATTLSVWTKDDLKDIKDVKFRSCNTLEEKQSKMIAYAFEKAYDLAISPAHNVSRNPGFETPLGFFRRWT